MELEGKYIVECTRCPRSANSGPYRKGPAGFDPVRSNEQNPVDLDSLSDVVREREELARLRVREEQLRRREQELRERHEALRRRENG